MRLALWDEQGLGDRLLAANLLRNLKGSGIETVLECHPRLESIYRRSFPWIDHIFATAKEDYIEWPNDLPPTHKCAVMSLAKIYWKDGNFNRAAYITPNDAFRANYRANFERLGKGPYIAFAWKGGALKTNTKYRSLKLGWFENMIREVGGTWISMQYHDDAKEKVERFRNDTGLPVFHCDAAQEFNYDHTLAALAAVDTTVTACNSVVHTCGAAGLPCNVLVPKRRAWRYPKTEFFPWYGSCARMYHQDDSEDWKPVLEKLTAELKFWRSARESGDSRTRTVAA